MIKHQNDEHNSKIFIESLHFDTWEEFSSWKRQEEIRTESCYVRDSSMKTYGSANHYYFYCNRSGDFVPKGHGKRQLKLQSSSKTGTTCVAHIKAIENTLTNAITIEYCSTHNTHGLQLCHLPLPDDMKHYIAAKLQDGTSVDEILNDIREKIGSHGVSREHLLTKQDIYNIKRKLNLKSVQKHTNDLTSVCAWVEELKSLPYNPILNFKLQGDSSFQGITGSLTCDTFLLSIQTEYQCNALRYFGNKIICMDSTHGTNVYDFLLVSILVVDDHGEGLPVAWAITTMRPP